MTHLVILWAGYYAKLQAAVQNPSLSPLTPSLLCSFGSSWKLSLLNRWAAVVQAIACKHTHDTWYKHMTHTCLDITQNTHPCNIMTAYSLPTSMQKYYVVYSKLALFKNKQVWTCNKRIEKFKCKIKAHFLNYKNYIYIIHQCFLFVFLQ